MGPALSTVLSTIVGVFVGGLITWGFARYYYRAATRDLQTEAERFAKIIDGVFESLASSGWIIPTRDANDRIVSIAPRFGLAKPDEKR